MHYVAAFSAGVWLACLGGGYAIARFQDPLPRSGLRMLVQQQFALECVSWKIYCLTECLVMLLLLCTLPALACAACLTRCFMFVSRPGRKHASTSAQGDPVFAWYCASWPARLLPIPTS
jgi:hypothetical protein